MKSEASTYCLPSGGWVQEKNVMGEPVRHPGKSPMLGSSATGVSELGAASLTQTFLTVAGQKDEAAYKPNVGPATTRGA